MSAFNFVVNFSKCVKMTVLQVMKKLLRILILLSSRLVPILISDLPYTSDSFSSENLVVNHVPLLKNFQ